MFKINNDHFNVREEYVYDDDAYKNKYKPVLELSQSILQNLNEPLIQLEKLEKRLTELENKLSAEEDKRKKYPAVAEAYDQYQTMLSLVENGDKDETETDSIS